MSLSKKNLDKLNNFKKNKNLNNEIKNTINYTNKPNNDNSILNPLDSEDPNKIFYSLIDNSESLEETSNVNNSLRTAVSLIFSNIFLLTNQCCPYLFF